ncbi:MAG TPA: hypothetical protein VK174_11025 [Chitinophagales bacterium]|nr:hypothetical protein [Chitinophagales bacterium]
MKRLLPLLAVVLMFTAQSCKENLCEGVVCNNGGTCKDGECQCLPAWTGVSCDVHTNGCDTVVCLNGGNCLDATCSCPAHTSGQFCQIQETPAKMWIHRVVIEEFSPANSVGQEWDGSGGKADVFPVIRKGNTILYDGFAKNVTRTDANYNTFMPFVLGLDSVIIDEIRSPDYVMEMWDADGTGPHTLMYSKSFTPYTDSTGFRGTIELTDTSTYLKQFIMGVNLSYSW